LNSGTEKEEERHRTEEEKTKEAHTEGGRNGLKRHAETQWSSGWNVSSVYVLHASV